LAGLLATLAAVWRPSGRPIGGGTESYADVHHRLVTLMLAALDGVPVSDYECDVLSWVACWETHTIAVLTALLRRARAA
jgi:hypothetical protein